MITIMIVSDDKDIVGLVTSILNQAGYEAVYAETVAELFQNSASIDFILLDRPLNLSSDDWSVLKKLKEAKGRKLPIAITNMPQTPWLQQRIREVAIDMIFPYPCDLTVEIPKLLETYFGSWKHD